MLNTSLLGGCLSGHHLSAGQPGTLGAAVHECSSAFGMRRHAPDLDAGGVLSVAPEF